MKRKSTRRDFLRGRAAADALADRAQQALSALDASADSYLLRIDRKAMACLFEVFLNVGQHDRAMAAALDALDLVDSLETQLSVFRASSEISEINRTAADEPVPVEPRLFALLQTCLRLYEETDGAFDITAGPYWSAWGFSRREGRVPTDNELRDAAERVGSRWVELDAEQQTVRFLKPGIELNLGSIGKGYALDRCAETLADAAVSDFLIHGGQSSVLARGARQREGDGGEHAAGDGWSVGVRHPLHPEQRAAEIRLRDRSLGTSGSRVQSFRHQGRRYGHVLDPRTGRPAEGVLAATAITDSAALSDALATAFFVMGADAVERFCENRPETAAMLIRPGTKGRPMEMISIGLADDELTVR